jgi:hypothetical protein
MSSEAVPRAVYPLAVRIFDERESARGLSVLGWIAALGAHALVAGLAVSEARRPPSALPALEVEVVLPEPAALPTPPEPAAAPIAAPTPAPAEHPQALKAAAAPPQPARAGALLTAKPDTAPAPGADEPVDFTNDPNVLGFGSGVVAIGGKALVGVASARVTGAASGSGVNGAAPRSTGEALTPASDLSRKPGLGESDPCRGFFPANASDDVASAAVMVTIAKSGAVSNVRLLSESPSGQGFGAAARTCMTGKRFSPGLDRDGNPTATAVRVNIRFMR